MSHGIDVDALIEEDLEARKAPPPPPPPPPPPLPPSAAPSPDPDAPVPRPPSREPSRARNDGVRERSRERSRGRERSRERERPRRDERERHEPRGYQRDYRPHPRDAYHRDRHRDGRADRERRPRSPSPTAEERTAAETARNELTVLVQRVHPRADDFELFEFFSQAGTVVDIRLIKDARSGRSKGVAYVEFADAESVLRAMALNGILFMQQPLLVTMTMAERNQQPSAAKQQQARNALAAAQLLAGGDAAGDAGAAGGVPCPTQLRLAHIPAAVTHDDLKEVLEAFGPLTALELEPPSGSVCGALAAFGSAADAATALEALQGVELQEGFTLSVAYARVAPPPLPPGALLPAAPPPPLGMLLRAPALAPQVAASTLAAAGLVGAGLAPALAPLIPALPSEFLAIQNMFDPDDPEAKDVPTFFSELLEDVCEECDALGFGAVQEGCLDPTARPGVLCLRFESPTVAVQVAGAMAGRWYAGRQLVTAYLPAHAFAAARAAPDAVHKSCRGLAGKAVPRSWRLAAERARSRLGAHERLGALGHMRAPTS